MIATKDILFSITKTLSKNFSEDVLVDEQSQRVDDDGNIVYDSCFFIQVIPSIVRAATKTTNIKTMIVSIKYYPKEGTSNTVLYDVNDKLQNIYSRVIKVKDRVFTISSIEPTFLEDEVGNMLDFLITFTFHDDIYIEEEICDVMRNVEFKIKGPNKKHTYFLTLEDGSLLEV